MIKNRDEQDSHCINAIPDGELRLDRQFYFGNAKEAEEEIAAQQLKNEVNEAYGKYISAHNELMSLIDKTK